MLAGVARGFTAFHANGCDGAGTAWTRGLTRAKSVTTTARIIDLNLRDDEERTRVRG